MKHPFEILRPEYSQLLSAMVVREECRKAVDEVAVKLIGYKTRYEPVTAINGVPVVFIGPSFEREASSNFNLNPAQGASLHRISNIIPHNGPFKTWQAAALAAYHIDGLDRVGAANWSWELICFYGELFNGMGYRDDVRPPIPSPYLWGGTNIQSRGKYTSDGHYDPNEMDPQLGIIPVGRRMVELDPSLALPATPYVPITPISSGMAAEPESGTKWVQETLNNLGYHPPLDADGNYGRQTKMAVEQFQRSYGLDVDGLVGAATTAALKQAAAAAAEPAAKEGTDVGKT